LGTVSWLAPSNQFFDFAPVNDGYVIDECIGLEGSVTISKLQEIVE
jgi:hypothetical protein